MLFCDVMRNDFDCPLNGPSNRYIGQNSANNIQTSTKCLIKTLIELMNSKSFVMKDNFDCFLNG